MRKAIIRDLHTNILSKNKKIKLLITIVNIVYMTILTFSMDPFKENYSMTTCNAGGYIKILLMFILISIDFVVSTKKISNKYLFLSFGPIIGSILPYDELNRNLISEIHVFLAYVGFFFCIVLTLVNIFYFTSYNNKKGNRLLRIFIFILFVDVVYYLNSFGVIAIEQYLILMTMIIINTYMYIDGN